MMTPVTHYALMKMGKKGFNDLSEEDQDKVSHFCSASSALGNLQHIMN